MISTLFGTSKPINQVLLMAITAVLFLASNAALHGGPWTPWTVFMGLVGLLTLALSIFIIDFIIYKNRLTKRNNYALFIFTVLLGSYPYIYTFPRMLLAHVFLLLAFRRLLSLRSQRSVKSKIFDGALWVCVAGSFHDWTLIYLLAVFLAISVFKVADSKNVIIPFIAVGVVGMLYFTYCYLFYPLDAISRNFSFSMKMDTEKYSGPLFMVPTLWSLIVGGVSLVFYLYSFRVKGTNRKMTDSFMLVLAGIGIVIGIITDRENGSEHLFSLFPASVIITNYIERVKNFWYKEAILLGFLLLPITMSVLYFLTKG